MANTKQKYHKRLQQTELRMPLFYYVSKFILISFSLLYLVFIQSAHAKEIKQPLNNVLDIFVKNTSEASTWEAFNQIKVIKWYDQKPIKNQTTQTKGAQYTKSGRILLAGFSQTRLPNGKAGMDYKTVTGNEGISGITLTGDANRVFEIAVQKYYPTTRYEKLIQNQLEKNARIQRIADRCQDKADEKAAFYRIDLNQKQSVFAQFSIDEEGSKYSPGSTTIIFYRVLPKKIIERFNCQYLTGKPNN